MSITLTQIKNLKRGDILIDGVGRRWKVNGMVKRWKTMPDRVYVPLKHGLYAYDSIDNSVIHNGVCDLLTLESET